MPWNALAIELYLNIDPFHHEIACNLREWLLGEQSLKWICKADDVELSVQDLRFDACGGLGRGVWRPYIAIEIKNSELCGIYSYLSPRRQWFDTQQLWEKLERELGTENQATNAKTHVLFRRSRQRKINSKSPTYVYFASTFISICVGKTLKTKLNIMPFYY